MVLVMDERVVVERVLYASRNGGAVADARLLDVDFGLLFAEFRGFEREALFLDLLEARFESPGVCLGEGCRHEGCENYSLSVVHAF